MRSHRLLVPAAVLLALGCLTWLVLGESAAFRPRADVWALPAPAPERATEVSVERLAAGVGAGTAAEEPSTLRRYARPALAPPADERLTIEVVDPHGAPLPDVELLVFDGDRHDRSAMLAARRDPSTAAGLLQRLRSLGEVHRTDADGRVLVPWSGKPTHLAAVTGHGPVWDDPRPEVAGVAVRRIVVAPPLVTVRVLDHAGRPVEGARVLLFESAIDAFPWFGTIEGVFTGQAGLAVTDAEGFAHPDGLAMSGETLVRVPPDDGGELWARADALTRTGAQVRVPPGTSRSAPAVIRLPPTAPVVVEVRRPDGALAVDEPVGVAPAAESPAAVEARRFGRPDADGRRPGGMPLLQVPTVDGRARFERVEVGLELWLECAAHGRGLKREERRPGPPTAGREHLVTWELPLGRSVAGRVRDADGEPFRGELVDVHFDYVLGPRTLLAGLSMLTDGEGRFEIGLPEKAIGRVPVDWEALERLDVTVAPTEEGGAPRSSATSLAGPLAPGTHDLGELSLVPLPVLVTGRVVGPDGEPVEGAWVQPQCAPHAQGALPVPPGWTPLVLGRPSRTDVDGRFVLHRPPRDLDLDRFRLGLAVVRGDGGRAAPVEVEPGDTGVVLRVEARGVTTDQDH